MEILPTGTVPVCVVYGYTFVPMGIYIPYPLSHGYDMSIASYPRVYPFSTRLLSISRVTRLLLLTYELEYEIVISICC
jgi:hypothetical protein